MFARYRIARKKKEGDYKRGNFECSSPIKGEKHTRGRRHRKPRHKKRWSNIREIAEKNPGVAHAEQKRLAVIEKKKRGSASTIFGK